jgi:beta-galactosidase
MHYPRIPRAYWRDRLRMARAMGLDAVSTYVFWNRHEPSIGAYDFEGENDVAAFVRMAQEEELDVILRPGPYVCAEWDFGGLPAWLLADDNVRIRSNTEPYMGYVRTWLRRLGQELAPLQSSRGGPIVAVQLENEYGAFGSDAAYLQALRAALLEAGFDSPLYTIDQPSHLIPGSLADVPIAVTFPPGDPANAFAQLRQARSGAPLIAGEYWAGWFDHWGEPHSRRDDAQQVKDLEWMLAQRAGVNIYMFHGGTNFGFWNGANSSDSHAYQPTTTSYDYDAALDEAGRPTEKFFAFREAIATARGVLPSQIPEAPRTTEIAECSLDSCAPLADALGTPLESKTPLSMEALGQSFGYVLYRTRIRGPLDGTLRIDDLRDYAVVSLDGNVVAHLDRRLEQSRADIAVTGESGTLDILVENGGRINYGPDLPFECKGIRRATLDGAELHDWQMFCLPLRDLTGLGFARGSCAQPAFYRGTMTVESPADSFLDVSGLGKGVLWINGRNAGRFWNIGPQETLYVPGVWMRPGENEVTVLELYARERAPQLRGLRNPRYRKEASRTA